jgi:hypothetical protein
MDNQENFKLKTSENFKKKAGNKTTPHLPTSVGQVFIKYIRYKMSTINQCTIFSLS